MIGQAAKILAPDWLSTPLLYLVGFRYFVHNCYEFRSGSLELDFLSRIVCAKNTWKSSATVYRGNSSKVNFHFLQETAKDYFCQKLKT